MILQIVKWWKRKGGASELLKTAFPLILSSASSTIQQVVDRLFLSWYSSDALAAAMPAGMLNFLLQSFFLGTAGYASTFIAQYYGAKIEEDNGAVIFSSILISLFGSIFIALTVPFAPYLFKFFGHTDSVLYNEISYFSILSLGSCGFLFANSLSCFFSGRGNTWPVFLVSILSTIINSILNYLLIFGKLGLPSLGIKGAGIATVITGIISCFIYLLFLLSKPYKKICSYWKKPFFRKELLLRLLHFGYPAGLQFFLDMIGWTIVIILIGRIGKIELASSNIAFNINTFAFMPMIGIGIAVSILVGQYLGKNEPKIAEQTTWNGFLLTFIYMASVSTIYILLPQIFIKPYILYSKIPQETEILKKTASIILKFVGIYSIFDTMNVIFPSALKGAGDTLFVMLTNGIISLILLIIPVSVAIIKFNSDIILVWIIITLYIIVSGFIYLIRFIQGKWKNMRVIGTEIPSFTIPGPK